MHTKTEHKQSPAAQVGRPQDLPIATNTHRSIETYYQLLRSGRPLSELLADATRNSDRGQAMKSDFAVQPDAQGQDTNAGHEIREQTHMLLAHAERIEQAPSSKSEAHALSETLLSTDPIEARRPSGLVPDKRLSSVGWTRFAGRTVASIGAIGIFLYPLLTDAPTSDRGPPFQNTGEIQSARPREEPPANAIGGLTSPIEAASKIAVALPTSTTALSSGSDTVGSTVLATETKSPLPPPAVIPSAATGSTATVEIKSDPPTGSTPAIEAKIDPDPTVTAMAAAEVPAIAEHQVPEEQIAALVSRGDKLMGLADVVSARLFYERAADAGDARAALRLGQTYDPSFLSRVHLAGVRGELTKAAYWYRYARGLGLPEAEGLLEHIEIK